MIDIFIRGLPLDMRSAMKGEYQSKRAELSRWLERTKSKRNRQYLSMTDVLDVIIALGIYYRTIIAPIECVEEFITGLTVRPKAEFKIAGKPFSKKQLIGLREGIMMFDTITGMYGLDKQLLAERELRTMLLALISREEAMEAFREVPI